MGLALEATALSTGSVTAANGADSMEVTSTVDTGISWGNTGSELDTTIGVEIKIDRDESFYGIAFVHMYLERYKNDVFERDDLLKTFDVGRYGGTATDYRELGNQNDEQTSAGHLDNRSGDNIVGYLTAQNGTYYRSSRFPRHDGSGGWGLHHDREDLDVGQNYKYRLRFEYGFVIKMLTVTYEFNTGGPGGNPLTSKPSIKRAAGYWEPVDYTYNYRCPTASSDFTYRGVTVNAASASYGGGITTSDLIKYTSFSSNVNYTPLLLDYIISDFSALSTPDVCYRPTVELTTPSQPCTLYFYINGSLVDTAVVTTSGTTTTEVTSNSTLRTSRAYTLHLDGATSVTRGSDVTCYVKAIKTGDSSISADSNSAVLNYPALPAKQTPSATTGQFEVVTVTWTGVSGHYYRLKRGSTVIRGPEEAINRHQDAHVGSTTYYLETSLYDPYYDEYPSLGYSSGRTGSAVAAPAAPTLGVTNCSMLLSASPAEMIIGGDGLSESSLRALTDPYFSNSDKTVYSIYEEVTSGSLSSTLRGYLASNFYVAIGIDGVVKSCLNPVLKLSRAYNYRQSGPSGIINTSLNERFVSDAGSHGFGATGSPYFNSETTYEVPTDQVKFYILNIGQNGDYQAPSGSATDILLDRDTFRVGNYDFANFKPLANLGVQVDGSSIGNNGNQALNYFDDMVPCGYTAGTINNSYFTGDGAAAQFLGTSGGTSWLIDPNKGRISRNVGGSTVDWWNAASGRTRLSYDSSMSLSMEVTSLGNVTLGSWTYSNSGPIEFDAALSGTELLTSAAIPGNHQTGSMYLISVTPKTGGSISGFGTPRTAVILSTLETNVREPLNILTLNYGYTDTGTAGNNLQIIEPAYGAASTTTTISIYRSGNSLYIERSSEGSYVGFSGLGDIGYIAPPPPPTVWGSGAGGYTHTHPGLDIIIRRIK